jgi:ribonuclease Z
MKAVIVGSGSALPDPLRGNPCQAVVVDGEVLLFDCGERATVNLVKSGINPLDVDHVFFTHLHWDHIADFNYLLMTTWNCGKCTTMNVYGPVGTSHMTQSILEAHSVDVEFVKRFLNSLPEHITDRPVPEPPVQVHEISEGTVLETDKYRVTAREVAHLNLLDFEHSSYGYRVDSDHGSVALTGDTGPCESMIELAKDVDILIHECTFLEETIQQREMRGHSGPRDAGRVARKAGAKKLVLTHLGPYDSLPAAVEMASMYYGPRRGPEVWSQILREAASEFGGPIILGEDALELQISRGN